MLRRRWRLSRGVVPAQGSAANGTLNGRSFQPKFGQNAHIFGKKRDEKRPFKFNGKYAEEPRRAGCERKHLSPAGQGAEYSKTNANGRGPLRRGKGSCHRPGADYPAPRRRHRSRRLGQLHVLQRASHGDAGPAARAISRDRYFFASEHFEKSRSLNEKSKKRTPFPPCDTHPSIAHPWRCAP